MAAIDLPRLQAYEVGPLMALDGELNENIRREHGDRRRKIEERKMKKQKRKKRKRRQQQDE